MADIQAWLDARIPAVRWAPTWRRDGIVLRDQPGGRRLRSPCRQSPLHPALRRQLCLKLTRMAAFDRRHQSFIFELL